MQWTPGHIPKAGFNHTAWIFILLVLFMNGCVSGPRELQPAFEPSAPKPAVSHPPDLQQRLRSEVQKWLGTPHRMGGTDHSGVDCSGFVQRVYQDLFGLQLPRTTSDQVRYAEKIEGPSLQTGDLVFFRPSKNVGHVGIYLGGSEFAHASKSSGVIVSRLDDPYWRAVYWTAGRVLPETP